MGHGDLALECGSDLFTQSLDGGLVEVKLIQAGQVHKAKGADVLEVVARTLLSPDHQDIQVKLVKVVHSK